MDMMDKFDDFIELDIWMATESRKKGEQEGIDLVINAESCLV